eukprot:TRINITY_DN3016_c0_g1_i1.p1 TRINITY_DN3016_c0_g1~~TRINITY_DN3016_c0_g1_i1.p1  ORF type:complete len:385 (+),score=99.31 TRINITY_DN3016_c0_g1_i1:172-1326(+)
MSIRKLEAFERADFEPFDMVNEVINEAVGNLLKTVDIEKFDFTTFNTALANGLANLDKYDEEVLNKLKSINFESEMLADENLSDQQQLIAEHQNLKKELAKLDEKMKQCQEGVQDLANEVIEEENTKQKLLLESELLDYFLLFNKQEQSNELTFFYDPNNLKKAAQYLYYLHKIVQNLSLSEYQTAVNNIKHRYKEMETMLMSDFKEAYYLSNREKMQDLLQLIEKYQLSEELYQFYTKTSLLALKNDSSIVDFGVSFESNRPLLENFYSTLTTCFATEFQGDCRKMKEVCGDNYLDLLFFFVSNAFVHYVDKLIKETLVQVENDVEVYLTYYEFFFTKTRELVENIQSMRHAYDSYVKELVRTHFQNIFNEYRQKYLSNEERL